MSLASSEEFFRRFVFSHSSSSFCLAVAASSSEQTCTQTETNQEYGTFCRAQPQPPTHQNGLGDPKQSCCHEILLTCSAQAETLDGGCALYL